MANRRIQNLVLSNQVLVNRIAQAVIESSKLRKSLILQTAPARGSITEVLLANDASRLFVLEHDTSSNLHYLKKLFEKYPNSCLHTMKDDEFLIDKIRRTCKQRQLGSVKLDERRPITWLMSNHPLQDHIWIGCLLEDVTTKSGLFSHQHSSSEAFILLNDHTMNQLTKQRLSTRKIFLSSFFSFDKILDFEYKPPSSEFTLKKGFKTGRFDSSLAHLVRLSANEATFGRLSPDRVEEYKSFVRQALFRRNAGLVQFIDKFFPGLGPRIINCGFASYLQLHELTPEQYVKLFNECITWPEYKVSYFARPSTSSSEDFDEVVVEK